MIQFINYELNSHPRTQRRDLIFCFSVSLSIHINMFNSDTKNQLMFMALVYGIVYFFLRCNSTSFIFPKTVSPYYKIILQSSLGGILFLFHCFVTKIIKFVCIAIRLGRQLSSKIILQDNIAFRLDQLIEKKNRKINSKIYISICYWS